MKGGKAMGSDVIPIEVWMSLEDIAILWLTKFYLYIMSDMVVILLDS
jgi:hypothetical protein